MAKDRSRMDEEGVGYLDLGELIVSSADAADFLEEKDVEGKGCPVCSTTQWTTAFCSPEGTATVFPTVTGLSSDDAKTLALNGRFIPVYFAVCDNCGYMRSHSLHYLVEWKKKKDGEAELSKESHDE